TRRRNRSAAMIVIAACRARTRRLMRPSGFSTVGAVYDRPQCRIETSRAVILLRLRAVALALRGPPLQFRPYAGARSGSTGPALSVSDPLARCARVSSSQRVLTYLMNHAAVLSNFEIAFLRCLISQVCWCLAEGENNLAASTAVRLA